MQGIYIYVPELYHICREYNVASILWLEFMVYLMLFPMIKVLDFDISTS
jgi:hypothetical protein